WMRLCARVVGAFPDGRTAKSPKWRACPLGIDVSRGETSTHRLDQMGQAALHADGSAAQPGKAGGSSLRTGSRATDSKQKVRKICCTTNSRGRWRCCTVCKR